MNESLHGAIMALVGPQENLIGAVRRRKPGQNGAAEITRGLQKTWRVGQTTWRSGSDWKPNPTEMGRLTWSSQSQNVSTMSPLWLLSQGIDLTWSDPVCINESINIFRTALILLIRRLPEGLWQYRQRNNMEINAALRVPAKVYNYHSTAIWKCYMPSDPRGKADRAVLCTNGSTPRMPAVTHNLSHSHWLGHEESHKRQENGHTVDSHETIRRPGLRGRHQPSRA